MVTGLVIAAQGGETKTCNLEDPGCSLAPDFSDLGFERPLLGALLGGLAGAGLGALLGSLFQTERWEVVSLEGVDMSAGPEPGGGFGLTARAAVRR